MAHSPLLRTLMRLKLDRRSVALVNYELALENVSTSLQRPPSKENFDDSRWTDLRKGHENKKEREKHHKLYEEWYVTTITKKREMLDSSENKQLQYNSFYRAWKDIIPQKTRHLRSAIAKSGFTEWKPPLPLTSLRFEQGPPASPSCGRVDVGDIGILDRRLLHHAISPKYVPKPHFKMERKRLAAKSAEFAAFVAQQTSLGPKRSLIPRPEDESSDQGLLSPSETEDSAVRNSGSKRKRPTTGKTKKRTRKPPSFSKLYDCKAHDQTQLKAQAINWFSLMQQRQPRVESPAIEQVGRTTADYDIKLQTAVDADEDPSIRILDVHGILLPVQFPRGEEADGEEEQHPTIEDAARYRDWRSRAKPFFEERDRYIQNRIYCERAQDRKLSHAAQDLMSFWNRISA
ncbi:hypothetical protein F4818DRAFT_437135 [Hypoxylon cercidicola]|nr:hypothetical protein F4818DRAFT_437135 [Hypoxylon cercidicola]